MEADGERERDKERSKFNDITGVGLCQRACVESGCECTRACAGQKGGLRAKQ